MFSPTSESNVLDMAMLSALPLSLGEIPAFTENVMLRSPVSLLSKEEPGITETLAAGNEMQFEFSSPIFDNSSVKNETFNPEFQINSCFFNSSPLNFEQIHQPAEPDYSESNLIKEICENSLKNNLVPGTSNAIDDAIESFFQSKSPDLYKPDKHNLYKPDEQDLYKPNDTDNPCSNIPVEIAPKFNINTKNQSFKDEKHRNTLINLPKRQCKLEKPTNDKLKNTFEKVSEPYRNIPKKAPENSTHIKTSVKSDLEIPIKNAQALPEKVEIPREKTSPMIPASFNIEPPKRIDKENLSPKAKLDLKRPLLLDSSVAAPSKRLKLNLRKSSAIQKTEKETEKEKEKVPNCSTKQKEDPAIIKVVPKKENQIPALEIRSPENLKITKDKFNEEIAHVKELRKKIEAIPIKEARTDSQICLSALEEQEKHLLQKLKFLKISHKQLLILDKLKSLKL